MKVHTLSHTNAFRTHELPSLLPSSPRAIRDSYFPKLKTGKYEVVMRRRVSPQTNICCDGRLCKASTTFSGYLWSKADHISFELHDFKRRCKQTSLPKTTYLDRRLLKVVLRYRLEDCSLQRNKTYWLLAQGSFQACLSGLQSQKVGMLKRLTL